MAIKNEYPRPQFVRNNWQNLNGEWQFAFDDDNRGIKEKWYVADKELDRSIVVPYVYQSELSGIKDRTPHDIVWYKKTITTDNADKEKEVILHFGAVDYEAQVFINGHEAAKHVGGHVPFSVNITPYMKETEQVITVRVYDPHNNEFIPRGKQFWEDESRGIWYTNSTGIWQTVWIECISKTHIKNIKFTSLYDEGKINIKCAGSEVLDSDKLLYRISYHGKMIAEGNLYWKTDILDFSIDIVQSKIFNTNFHDEGRAWTPENPALFDVELMVTNKNGEIYDEVKSYFGFRKVHTENGMVYLNNKPYYQKLVLDQGYWPNSLLTAPDDEAFINDIKLSKQMGFNGCRKHQKFEDPRFLYWADRLGFIVWGESPSPIMYNEESVKCVMNEWAEVIERDYNHPSIIVWVPINESWGIPNVHKDKMQQHFSLTMYHFLHSIDNTRLVISNDGWEMTKTDICAIHNYRHGEKNETLVYQEYKNTLATRESLISYPSTCWDIYSKGHSYEGEPIILTEFGGIGFDVSGNQGWGYTSVNNETEFIEEYSRIMDAVYESKGLWGFCYTQLVDVEQEINGLLTYDRKPKCDLSQIKRINNHYHINRVI